MNYCIWRQFKLSAACHSLSCELNLRIRTLHASNSKIIAHSGVLYISHEHKASLTHVTHREVFRCGALVRYLLRWVPQPLSPGFNARECLKIINWHMFKRSWWIQSKLLHVSCYGDPQTSKDQGFIVEGNLVRVTTTHPLPQVSRLVFGK